MKIYQAVDPVFQFKLNVVICPKDEYITHTKSKGYSYYFSPTSEANFHVILHRGKRIPTAWLSDHSLNLLVHECVHAAHHITQHHNLKPDEEFLANYTAFLVSEIAKQAIFK